VYGFLIEGAPDQASEDHGNARPLPR